MRNPFTGTNVLTENGRGARVELAPPESHTHTLSLREWPTFPAPDCWRNPQKAAERRVWVPPARGHCVLNARKQRRKLHFTSALLSKNRNPGNIIFNLINQKHRLREPPPRRQCRKQTIESPGMRFSGHPQWCPEDCCLGSISFTLCCITKKFQPRQTNRTGLSLNLILPTALGTSYIKHCLPLALFKRLPGWVPALLGTPFPLLCRLNLIQVSTKQASPMLPTSTLSPRMCQSNL